MKLVNVY